MENFTLLVGLSNVSLEGAGDMENFTLVLGYPSLEGSG